LTDNDSDAERATAAASDGDTAAAPTEDATELLDTGVAPTPDMAWSAETSSQPVADYMEESRSSRQLPGNRDEKQTQPGSQLDSTVKATHHERLAFAGNQFMQS
jgi:hypothetical protein